MSKVFLLILRPLNIDGSLRDIKSLENYGRVIPVVCTGGRIRPDMTVPVLINQLRNFDPQEDYIAWAGGDSCVAFMAGAVMASLGIDMTDIAWLRWQKGAGDRPEGYFPIDINIPQPDPYL